MITQQSKQHLAIFTPPFLDLILEGRKIIEGRFSKVRCAPFGVVKEGDTVLMKDSGGPVRGSFLVAKVESFENLAPEKLKELETRYSTSLCADADPEYWKKRRICRYATMLHIAEPRRFEQPFSFPKKDRRGWVVLEGQKNQGGDQLPLLREKNTVGDPSESHCSNGLHTFFRSPLTNSSGHPLCRRCGADCVNWSLLHRRDPKDVRLGISELRKEYWRDSWFCREIDLQAKNHALRKGRRLLREHAENRIRRSVGPSQPYRDGFQTSYTGNIVYYAQHAVATCCRNCIEVWHGIQKGRELTDQDVAYLVQLVMCYVDTVMPNLEEEGVSVPPVRKSKKRKE